MDASMLRTQVAETIRATLINKSLEKYKTWGQKLARVLLNALIALPIVTLPLKKALTGTYFFSIKGKSEDAAEDALEELKKPSDNP